MRPYSGPLSMVGAKVEIAALEKGLPVKVFMVPYEPQAGYEPKHPDVVRINPKRQAAWRTRMAQRAAVAQVAGTMMDYLMSTGRRVPEFMSVRPGG